MTPALADLFRQFNLIGGAVVLAIVVAMVVLWWGAVDEPRRIMWLGCLAMLASSVYGTWEVLNHPEWSYRVAAWSLSLILMGMGSAAMVWAKFHRPT